MNVRELIAELTKLDGDAEVRIEGCDCINAAKSVDDVIDEYGYVLIEAQL